MCNRQFSCSYSRITPRKTPEAMRQHLEQVQAAASIVFAALGKIDATSRQPGAKLALAVPKLRAAVVMHDVDKNNAVDDVTYDAHDLVSPHHVANWIANGGRITVGGFLEHVIDHMAVNAQRTGEPPFIDSHALTSSFIFARDDMSKYFNMSSAWVQAAVERAKRSYDALVFMLKESAAYQHLPVR